MYYILKISIQQRQYEKNMTLIKYLRVVKCSQWIRLIMRMNCCLHDLLIQDDINHNRQNMGQTLNSQKTPPPISCLIIYWEYFAQNKWSIESTLCDELLISSYFHVSLPREQCRLAQYRYYCPDVGPTLGQLILPSGCPPTYRLPGHLLLFLYQQHLPAKGPAPTGEHPL